MVSSVRPYVPDLAAAEAFVWKQNYMRRIQPNALMVGFERGGLLACALQEVFPATPRNRRADQSLAIADVVAKLPEDDVLVSPGDGFPDVEADFGAFHRYSLSLYG